MANQDEKKELLEHMEDRTQWREEDKKRIERLRDDVEAEEKGRDLDPFEAEKNKVEHKH